MPGLLDGLKAVASGILQPVKELVDEFHTSGEEKMAFEAQKLVLKAQLLSAQQDMEARLYEAETARIKAVEDADTARAQAQAQVQVAEQSNGNWLAQAWRPIVGLMFAFQMFLIYGLPAIQGADATVHPPEEFWYANLGILGVAIAGRTAEKIARSNGRKRAAAAD